MHSQWGKIKANLVSESVNTPLQDKLEDMAGLVLLSFPSPPLPPLFLPSFLRPASHPSVFRLVTLAQVLLLELLLPWLPQFG
jgi:hypothetical protein